MRGSVHESSEALLSSKKPAAAHCYLEVVDWLNRKPADLCGLGPHRRAGLVVQLSSKQGHDRLNRKAIHRNRKNQTGKREEESQANTQPEVEHSEHTASGDRDAYCCKRRDDAANIERLERFDVRDAAGHRSPVRCDDSRAGARGSTAA